MQSTPVIKVNSDLLQAYLLVRNERDQCSAQIDMLAICQKRHNEIQQSTNMEK